MKSPCTVTMNGEFPCKNEPWDDLSEAIQWCNYHIETQRASYYKIECQYGVLTYSDEQSNVNIFADAVSP